jgi:hypothetical protein
VLLDVQQQEHRRGYSPQSCRGLHLFQALRKVATDPHGVGIADHLPNMISVNFVTNGFQSEEAHFEDAVS